jgi:hypothetical protein
MKQALASTTLMLIARGAGSSAPGAMAADDGFALAIRNHRFDPAQLEDSVGKKPELMAINLDSTPEAFESQELKYEKVIAGKGRAIISIGSPKPGSYRFASEYREDTGHGRIVAK